jgi:DNA-damage-inducible protein D
MERKQIELYKNRFDEIIHEMDGVEFWYARELQKLLGYEQWRNFELTIHKAQTSCESAGVNAPDHFAEVRIHK